MQLEMASFPVHSIFECCQLYDCKKHALLGALHKKKTALSLKRTVLYRALEDSNPRPFGP